jgi:hypothetical protein
MSTAQLHWPTRSRATRPLLRTRGTAGLFTLPVFAGTVAVLTWAEWTFLHALGWTVVHAHDVNYPSSLARGDLGLFQSLDFAVLGLLTILFARGLRTQFVRRLPGVVASVAFGAAALGGLLSAFPTDLPGEAASWHDRLHGIGFVLLLLGNLAAFVAAGLALRDAPGWGRLWVYSVANAPAAILVAVALFPFDQVSFYAAVVVMLAYYGVLGVRMRRLGARPAGE